MALTQGTETRIEKGEYKYVAASNGYKGLKVRNGPGTSYGELGRFPHYSETSDIIYVDVLELKNGWIHHEGASNYGVPAGWSAIKSGGITYFNKITDPESYDVTVYYGSATAIFYYPDSGSTSYKKQKTLTRTSDPNYQLLAAPPDNTVSNQKSDIILTINPNNNTGTTSQTGQTWTNSTYTFSGWDEKTSASAPNNLTSGDSDYSASKWMWSLSDLYYYADYTLVSTSDPQYSNHIVTLTNPTKRDEISTYTVKFDANGGSVSTASTSVTKKTVYKFSKWTGSTGVTISGTTCTFKQTGTVTANYNSTTTPAKISSMPIPTKSGYEFLGWGTSANQTTDLIAGGEPSPEINSNITYIAIWKVKGTIRIYVEEDQRYRMALPYLHDGTRWRMAIPYLHNGTKYYIVAG